MTSFAKETRLAFQEGKPTFHIIGCVREYV